MNVGIFQVDGRMPNYAALKINGYHSPMGDTVRMNKPGDINYITVLFQENRWKAEQLLKFYPNSLVGGTGWDLETVLPPEIENATPDYSIYPDCDYSIGFTSRGCDGSCEFCVVPKKEGHTRSVATIHDILRPGNDLVVLLDNDFLGSPNYVERLQEIKDLNVKVNFCQGLNIKKINDFNAHLLSQVETSNRTRTNNKIHFAFDNPNDEQFIREGVTILNKAKIKPYRLMFYVLVGFNTTFEEDMARVNILRELGCDPYIMRYHKEDKRLNHFARWVNWRVYRNTEFEAYTRWENEQRRTGGQESWDF